MDIQEAFDRAKKEINEAKDWKNKGRAYIKYALYAIMAAAFFVFITMPKRVANSSPIQTKTKEQKDLEIKATNVRNMAQEKERLAREALEKGETDTSTLNKNASNNIDKKIDDWNKNIS